MFLLRVHKNLAKVNSLLENVNDTHLDVITEALFSSINALGAHDPAGPEQSGAEKLYFVPSSTTIKNILDHYYSHGKQVYRVVPSVDRLLITPVIVLTTVSNKANIPVKATGGFGVVNEFEYKINANTSVMFKYSVGMSIIGVHAKNTKINKTVNTYSKSLSPNDDVGIAFYSELIFSNSKWMMYMAYGGAQAYAVDKVTVTDIATHASFHVTSDAPSFQNTAVLALARGGANNIGAISTRAKPRISNADINIGLNSTIQILYKYAIDRADMIVAYIGKDLAAQFPNIFSINNSAQANTSNTQSGVNINAVREHLYKLTISIFKHQHGGISIPGALNSNSVLIATNKNSIGCGSLSITIPQDLTQNLRAAGIAAAHTVTREELAKAEQKAYAKEINQNAQQTMKK